MPCRSLAAFMCLFALAVSTLACSATRGAAGRRRRERDREHHDEQRAGRLGWDRGSRPTAGLPTGLRYTGTIWGSHPGR